MSGFWLKDPRLHYLFPLQLHASVGYTQRNVRDHTRRSRKINPTRINCTVESLSILVTMESLSIPLMTVTFDKVF